MKDLNSRKMTSAIRMQRLREKRKLEDPDYQRKETERIRLLRKQQKELMSTEQQDKLRCYEREKKRRQRARKREQLNLERKILL